MGPAHTKSKTGKTLYWFNRKRVTEQVYWAEVELLRQKRVAEEATAVEPINELIEQSAGPHLVSGDQFLAWLKTLDQKPQEDNRDDQLPPEVELQKEESEEFDMEGVGDALTELITELRDMLTPTVTAKEQAALLLAISPLAVHYSDILELCSGNTQSANALIGSLLRKGLIGYESKEDARFRLINDQDRYFTASCPEVQDARVVSFTPMGFKLACQAEKAMA